MWFTSFKNLPQFWRSEAQLLEPSGELIDLLIKDLRMCPAVRDGRLCHSSPCLLCPTHRNKNIHLEQRARLALNAVVTVSRSVLEHLVESTDDVMMLGAANCSFERTNDACVLRL